MSAAIAPPSRVQDMSPVSTTSEWSGVNNYNTHDRSDSSYSAAFNRGDSATASDYASPYPPPPYRPNGNASYGPPPMDPFQQRRPSESGSRGSSRTGSKANSRASDGTISDQQSRKYRRMEMELHQHYTVLRAYLRGGPQQASRPNKARDKLLRLSPVQFHELSTDVFDELQRRQAAAPLPGRPPRRENVPPFLQPRPDFHEKRNQARQKLSSLQTPRFRDLSTDVFCELERRFPHFARPDGARGDGARPQSRRPGSRGPGPNGAVPPTGSRPPPPRSNSYGQGPGYGGKQESAAGIPYFDNPPPNGSDYGRPMPKQFQSNTITPNKSTMVEDEDEAQGVEPRYDRSSDAFGLESSLTSPRSDRDTSATSQSVGSFGGKASQPTLTELQEKMNELEVALEAKEQELRRAQNQSKSDDDWSTVKQELEKKLDDAQRLNQSMQDELDRLHAERPAHPPDGTAQRDPEGKGLTGDGGDWRDKYAQLEEEHRVLQDQLTQQRELSEEVGRQGQMYLEEMRAMTEAGGGNLDREEKLQAEVHRLGDEVNEWKARYVKAKTQLRRVRVSSLGLSISRPDAGRYVGEGTLEGPDGLVKDVHVTKFQLSIDELLRIARSDEPAAVLDHMKTVVLAVRNITSDIDAGPSVNKDDEMARRRAKLKSKISATANNLITASKNFAAAGGLSPVSLVDAAASHLTSAVVDLLHTVKIRPTPPGELGDDDDGDGDDTTLEPLQSNGYFNIVESLRRRSAIESVYSALSTPPNDQDGVVGSESATHERSISIFKNGMDDNSGLGITADFATRREEQDLEELKMYLEDQADALVQSITSLVDAIRGEEPLPAVRTHMANITGSLDNITSSTEAASREASSYQAILREKSLPSTTILEECKNKLMQASADSEAFDERPGAKEFIQKVPPLAFQVARETRELVSRIMTIEPGRDDDFS